jgi:ornithine cyclodeaminase/alanine dehydrogenase-like protein (mu-crystallin family)
MGLYQTANVFIESNVGIQTELKGIEQYINGEIGDVIKGRKEIRQKNSDRTIFQSMGNAIEDGLMANMIYEKFIKL